MTVADKLAELGIELPEPPPVAGSYVPTVQVGDLIFTAGQLAAGPDGLVATGKVGADVDPETGQACARQCAINVLTQVQAAVGDLDKIRRVVKLTVFVASTPDFDGQAGIANGASDLLADVLGDAGVHARSAVGVASLPLGSPVEIEAIVQVAG